MTTEKKLRPLVVDLDGTLIRTDMLYESVLKLLRDHPLDIFKIPFWLLKGKANLKKKLTERVSIDPRLLPYNEGLIEWLLEEKLNGRQLILCTASNQRIALQISEHLKYTQNPFYKLISSNITHNVYYSVDGLPLRIW